MIAGPPGARGLAPVLIPAAGMASGRAAPGCSGAFSAKPFPKVSAAAPFHIPQAVRAFADHAPQFVEDRNVLVAASSTSNLRQQPGAKEIERAVRPRRYLERRCMSSEHFGRLAWQFKRVSGSSGLKVQAAIAC